MAAVDVWTVALGRRDRRRAHAALRTILAGYLNRPPDAIEIATPPQGKPHLPGEPLHFNLSHSRDIALVAVSRDEQAPVGIDVEHPRKFRSPAALARRICSERELTALGGASASAEIDADRLLRLWVRKEAVVKGTGDGLVRDLREVEVLDDDLGDGWRCLDLRAPAPGFHAALAIKARDGISLTTLALHLPPFP